jgi:hypothetical protein
MTRLVHKSVDVRPEVWRKLRVNAELSGVPLRDFLAYLIEQSHPIAEEDAERRVELQRVVAANQRAVRASATSEPY